MAKKREPEATFEPIDKDQHRAQLSNDPIVSEVIERRRRVQDWESVTRYRFVEDLKFSIGDSDNGYQWPAAIRSSRDTASKPSLTINIIRQHNLNVSNDLRKNKQSVKFLATGGEGSAESSEAIQDLFRYVERRSHAQDVYTKAREFQIAAGLGYIRLAADYVDNESFDQEIKILPINDPLGVYMDPDAQQKNRSDMNWCIVMDQVPTDEFKAAYPEHADKARTAALGDDTTDDMFLDENHTLVCEYFRKEPVKRKLLSFVEKGERRTVRDDKLSAEHFEKLVTDPMTKVREVIDHQVAWYLIIGNEVVDSAVWPGKHIPIIPVIGEESIVDGILDRKGHTRYMKDAQRIYNYNSSAQVEFVALQSKSPWLAPVAAIEGYETYWNTANTQNHSILPFKHIDDDGNPLPPPSRIEPPKSSEGFDRGMQTAFLQIQLASGQFENQMGQLGNERTGAAIGKRQEMSATATYHFQDNYETALRWLGEQFLDLFPHIYDTKRVFSVLSPDGASYTLETDPSARAAFFQQLDHMQQVSRRILNPLKIKFAVAPDVGPAHTTKNTDTMDSLGLLLTQAPNLIPIIGDILVGAMPFEKAMEASQRLKRMVPKEALGTGPSPAEQKLMAQNANLMKQLQELMQLSASDKIKLQGKAEMRDIDAYKAESDRLKVMAAALAPEQQQQILGQLVKDILGIELQPLIAANSDSAEMGEQSEEGPEAEAEAPPMPGAKRAPDGKHYISDGSGGWLRVEPREGKANG